MNLRLVLLAGIAPLLGSCLANYVPPMPLLATAEVSNDFDTYAIERVGLLPFSGKELATTEAQELQASFLSEVARATPYEVICLDADDLEMVEAGDPHRTGSYSPRTIIELSRRYNLDAILFGSVTDERFFPPQLLSLTLDLVSAETGLVVWSSSVHLDARDERVQDGLRAYYHVDDREKAWQIALLSPERFARFAAFQIALLL